MKKLFRIFLLLVAFTGVTPAHADTGATAVVQGFYDQLVGVMKDGTKLGYAGRYKKLAPTMQNSFNFAQMTRFAVGLSWSSVTPEQQQQITQAFSDFSVANYASRFAKYNGEKFDVVGEQPANTGVMVETTLTPKEGEPVKLNYLVQKDDAGNWRIVDVFLNGSISELAARRAEFSTVIKRDGVAALVNSLGEKSKAMGS